MLVDRCCGRLLVCALILTVLLKISCSNAPVQTSDGSGSETPNSATVISSCGRIEGTSNPYSAIGIYSSDYIPYNDSGFDTSMIADDKGRFVSGVLDSGIYNVLSFSAVPGTGAFFSGINSTPSAQPDTVILPLKPVGSVTGVVSDTFDILREDLPVYIPGSPYLDSLDNNNRFVLHDIPEGEFDLHTKDVASHKIMTDTLNVDTLFNITAGERKDLGRIKLE
ncbi:MAG: hypothetical protein GF401_02170 [Chitinivibrionales bacterium]|nr:hypothetical protein [Chitinivibrionales bacterium]